MTTRSIASKPPAKPAHPAAGGRKRGLWLGLAAALALGLAGGGWAIWGGGPSSGSAKVAGPDAFLAQMMQAAEGVPMTENVFGGAIVVERSGSQLTITADRVPPGICVSVGWKLVRKGLLSINGTTPMRVSAARLADLCNQGEGTAVLAWSPRPE
jgi:hypothetical protein